MDGQKYVVEDIYAQKLSDICNIPAEYIYALRDNGLMNQKEARNKLIRHDFRIMVDMKKYTQEQIFGSLSDTYGVSISYVKNLVSQNNVIYRYCRECGRKLTLSEIRTNTYWCNYCFIRK